MYSWEHEYLDLLHYVLSKGEQRQDRTGTGTRSVFAQNLTIDLAEGFPLITTKKMAWKAMVSELLWFIEGSGDERRLAEILHGTRDPEKKTIWSPNAEGTTGSSFSPSYPGDLGRIYGVQWRGWNRYAKVGDPSEPTYVKTQPVDQLQQLIGKLKTNPTDRRLILSAWNPGEIDQMALPPCHMFAQFYLSNDRRLSCQMYQRSVDLFLGLPFNIASYALLTHLIAKVVDAEPALLTMVLGDVHVYNNHVEAALEQIDRIPLDLPRLAPLPQVSSIDDFKMEDIQLVGYESHPPIKAVMSA